MFFLLSKSLDLAVSPLVWVIVLVGIALWLVARRSPDRRRIVGCLVVAIAVTLVFGNPFDLPERIFQSLEDDAPSTYDEAKVYDAVVLLGGVTPEGMTDPGRPSYNDNVERLLVAYELLRTNRAKNVIISGGVKSSQPELVPEASALGNQLEKWGIARDRIFIDDVAVNTRENAVETSRIAKERAFGKLLIVTSAFHMTRALGCFRAVDLEVDTLPVDFRSPRNRDRSMSVAPRTSALDRSGDAFRELLGRGVYRALGYTK